VRIQNVDDSIAESLGLGTARGALVAGIDNRGPAKPAGLMSGDVIVKFDGKEIKESRDLPKLVASLPVGKEVDVVIVRKGQEITKTVKLGRLEDGEKAAAAVASGDDEAAVEKKEISKAFGMELSGLSDEARKTFKIKDGIKGVVVATVQPNSPAAEKGLQAGDVIEEVNQQPGERAGRSQQGDRRVEKSRQEIGADARRQRNRRRSLRGAGDRIGPRPFFRDGGEKHSSATRNCGRHLAEYECSRRQWRNCSQQQQPLGAQEIPRRGLQPRVGRVRHERDPVTATAG
jgi:C-terminal processing protease CtpA/Prc